MRAMDRNFRRIRGLTCEAGEAAAAGSSRYVLVLYRERSGLLTQNIILHPDVKPSVAAVDEEEGIVLLWMNFGDTNSFGPGNALVTFEAFKVWGGETHAVNAFFRILPEDTQRGWPSAEQAEGER
jgi:hypothetical protein